MTTYKLDDKAIDLILREARSHHHWKTDPVPDELLKEIYDIAKMGPTSVNCQPMRLVFLKTEAAKKKLEPLLQAHNVEKVMPAPVIAVIAYDTQFYEYIDTKNLYRPEARSWFEYNKEYAKETAVINSSLQGGYLMIAIRALGLDCCAISGFDTEKFNAEFFPDGRYKVNFLITIGYGDHSKLHPRGYRFDFKEVCKVE